MFRKVVMFFFLFFFVVSYVGLFDFILELKCGNDNVVMVVKEWIYNEVLGCL